MVDHVWREADGTRGGRPVDLASLVAAAAERGPVTWRETAELALREPNGEAGRPLFLLEFLAELASALHPESILDPWVSSPTMLAAAHDASGSRRSCGLVLHDRMWEVAQTIAATVDWRQGDPLGLLQDLAVERFDLVLAAPPMGAHRTFQREADDPRAAVELADLVLWRAARLVRDGGHVLFHTSDSFLWANSRRRLWEALAERGLHPQAIVSVDRGLAPMSNAPTSVVMFGRVQSEQLFIGRLERDTLIQSLVQNLVRYEPAEDPQLGVLMAAAAFRGWRPFALERELAELSGSYELRRLTDIGTVRAVQLRPDRPYEAPANCVFVPSLGFGNVMTAPPDLEGRHGYRLFEVQLDPAVARAEYVAGLLSSAMGRQLRESVSAGATIPHLKVGAVAGLRIPVPPLSVQQDTVRSAAHLASMEATVARLRSELWRHPEGALRVLSRLEIAARADPVRRWLDTLPYPLASVLQRYAAHRDSIERLAQLLHFFEATAQFGCAVLLSVLRAAPELLDSTRPAIANVAPPGRELFDRADFGLWINLGTTLAKAVRRFNDSPEHRERLAEAAAPAGELMRQLAEKRIWSVLDQARPVRNARAHSGITSPDQVAGWLGTLGTLLSDTEQALGTGFEEIDLARADQGRFVNGLHVYPRAQRMRGPSDVFEEFEVRTRVPLESEHLAFVGRDIAISPVLSIVPLVRVEPTTSSNRNACYFFDSHLRGARFSYVSYHFENQPRIEVDDSELEEIARNLTTSLS